MRIFVFVSGFALALAVGGCTSTPATSSVARPSPSPVDVPAYAPLLARARAHDSTLDFGALRLAYTGTDDYEPYGIRDSDLRKQIYDALDAKDYSRARRQNEQLLAVNFVDLEGHGSARYIAEQAGDSIRSEYHFWVASGLLHSIEASGDGSAARPFQVISVAEEYAWAIFRGFRRKGTQSLAECGNRPCDAVEFTDMETRADTTLYFDVSIPFGRLSRSMGPK